MSNSAEVQFRPRASEDLVEIWSFIADHNETAADRLLDDIDRTFAMLARNPLAGRARAELGPELRSFPVRNYVVFYRALPMGIDVVRILSGFRDISPDHMT